MAPKAKQQPSAPPGTISAEDVARVRKERDRHAEGGGTWQAWDRIVSAVEDCHRVQQEFANTQQQAEDRASVAVDRWLPIGSTV